MNKDFWFGFVTGAFIAVITFIVLGLTILA